MQKSLAVLPTFSVVVSMAVENRETLWSRAGNPNLFVPCLVLVDFMDVDCIGISAYSLLCNIFL
jgi:hypothetical protein